MASLIPESLEDYVKCEVCRQTFRFITPAHLSKHGISKEEYVNRYPKALLCAPSYSRKRSQQANRLYKEKPELKQKLSKSQRERFQNQEELKKHSERMKVIFQNPEVRAKHRKGIKESWTSDRRQQISEKVKNIWEKNQERKKRHSEMMKNRWQQHRRTLAKTIRDISQDPKIRKRMRKGQRKLTAILKLLADKYLSEGYKAIPLHHGFPVPDLILVKDGRVISVEVCNRPNPEKYKTHTYYDEVIWLKKENLTQEFR